MSRVNREWFEFIEKSGKIGVTSRQFARRMWINPRYARTWLSRYTNYRRTDGTVRHYLTYNPPPPGSVRGGKKRVLGTYTAGPDWWGEMCFLKQELS